ncbi:Inner membrane protein YciS [Vibrio aerogenes CECT 7868]|uniref:Probable lipopolysaccharide assembly protein A n=1 Tax=Vibrio aerogenes CECT 7868 TaxID=1216006 RepID=A0A1M5X508_9VIBR|nr:lipopolysaccharide assembly protein LapA domain-containing protein [Vibrio aerogenes]SHH94886.1 Inner membrane protein YciS [Vibrio aerogenes CECT 7868]
MRIIKILSIIALFIIALALGAQNQETVTFNYLIAKGSFHLSWLMGMIFVIGFIIAWLIFGSLHLKSRLQIRKLNKQLKQYENKSQGTKDNIG